MTKIVESMPLSAQWCPKHYPTFGEKKIEIEIKGVNFDSEEIQLNCK